MSSSLIESRPVSSLRGMLLLSLTGHVVLFSVFLLIFSLHVARKISLPPFYEVTLLSPTEMAQPPVAGASLETPAVESGSRDARKEPPVERAPKQAIVPRSTTSLKAHVPQKLQVRVERETMADRVKKSLSAVKLPQEMVAVVPPKALPTPKQTLREKTPSEKKSLSEGEISEWVKKNLMEIKIPTEKVVPVPLVPLSQEKTPSPLSPPPPREGSSAGPQEVVSLPPPVAASTLSVEKSERFHFPEYLRIIQNKIGGMWAFPSREVREKPYHVVVTFTLLPSGEIDRVEVEESSGNSFLDQAALRAVILSSPLPPFPAGLEEKELKIHFGFILGRKS